MSAHTNPHSCKSKFWRPWQKISRSFASLGEFGAIQAQAVAKIFTIDAKIATAWESLSQKSHKQFFRRETSKAATADREECPLGIELPAAGAP